MRFAIGADHGGATLKDAAGRWLTERGFTVKDYGCRDSNSVDYPDFAAAVTLDVESDPDAMGVLVCTTGIGMSIAANKRPGIRAALCLTPHMARQARSHNAANVLVLGGALQSEADALAVLEAWVDTPFSGEDRHVRRIGKIHSQAPAHPSTLAVVDPELAAVVNRESARQTATLNLIASENTVSRAVCEAQGSLLTNKYAEGYPGRRWYSGCDFVDQAEALAIERACELFGAERANVQPHSGSSANMAVYMSMLKPGDTILAMSLADGGHLTHGSAVNFSGQLYNVVPYGVNRETEMIDYEALQKLAETHRPKLIVAGASAYPRLIDFARFRAIADGVGARLMVDMAHIAGLVAGGVHPSPVPVADYVSSTTHKTLRGPRSGFVLCREAYGRDIDKTVFPGLQGGPLMHVIAAKAVCFKEAMDPAFKTYAAAVVNNAQVMADVFKDGGIHLVSGGTDNHLMLLDVGAVGTTGKVVSSSLDAAGIIVNKNAIPFDTQSPFVTSGIRIGTPGVTSRGMGVDDMKQIASWILDIIRSPEDIALQQRIRKEVATLCERYPAG